MRLGRLFSSELGDNPYVPMKKEWIAELAGLGLSLYSGYKSAEAAEAAARKQRNREIGEEAYYRRVINGDATNTAWGQNQLRRVEQFNKKNWRRAKGSQAVGGGTDAATQMQKDAGNKLMADTMGNMAAANVARQEHADAVHQANQDKFMQMDMAREMQRSQNIANAGAAASNAVMQMGSLLENGTSLAGGSNKGVGTDTTPSTETVKVGDSNISVGNTGNHYTDQMSRMQDIEDAYNKYNATNLH